MTALDPRGTIQSAPQQLKELRGPSGRLYGMIDPQRLVIEFKKGDQVECIDLRPYLEAMKHE